MPYPVKIKNSALREARVRSLSQLVAEFFQRPRWLTVTLNGSSHAIVNLRAILESADIEQRHTYWAAIGKYPSSRAYATPLTIPRYRLK